MQRNNKKEKKIINGSKFKLAIVVSEFNEDITEKLLEGAQGALKENKVRENNIKIIRVPGSFEIPLACQKLARSKKFDAIIALGCVIKGETDHYYFIAGEASRGIMDIMLKYEIPIGFGVITTDNLEQALDRSIRNNKGADVARAILEVLIS